MTIVNTLHWTRGNGINALRTNCKATIEAPIYNSAIKEWGCRVVLTGVPELTAPITIYAPDAQSAIHIASGVPHDLLLRVQNKYALMGQIAASRLYDLSGLPTAPSTPAHH